MKQSRSSFRASLRTLAMVTKTIYYLSIDLRTSLKATGLPASITRRWHASMCNLGGVDVAVIGTPQTQGSVLFVSNHISYIDILVIGGVIDGCFIAKAEVEGWPVFGWLAKQRRTMFVERSSRHSKNQGNWLKDRLASGDDLILFPEGTSTDGQQVLPFKSTLFAAVENSTPIDDVIIQPITVAYNRYDGGPLCDKTRPRYAWYDDMTLGAHLWYWLGLKRVGVDLIFHEPVKASSYSSRKDLATHCFQVVAKGLQDSRKIAEI